MKKIVIKIGGNAATQLTPAFFDTIKFWQKQHYKIAIVHGGGDTISALMSQLNEPVQKINGIRFTTQNGINITKMALLGQVQPALLEACRVYGLSVIGLNAASDQLLTGHTIDQDTFGYVGNIHQVNTKLIHNLWEKNLIPIIAPMAITNSGQWLNVNADHAATALAKYLKADELYLLTDVSGVKIKGNVLQNLTSKTMEELQKKQMITGGMIPKVNSALFAARHGVRAVHITNTVNHPGTIVTI